MENKKVKNVVIINDFNYIQGGASKVAIDTARLLIESGVKVYFFSAVNKEQENIDGVTYISTNQNEALKEKNKIKGAINGVYNFKARRELKKLLKVLNKEDTIIHVHGWTKALSSSVFDIAFKMKFEVVLTLHDYFSACPNGGYFNYKQNQICHLQPLSLKCIKCNCDSRNYGFKLYRILRQFVQNKIVKLNDKLQYAIGISNLSIDILKSTLNSNIKVEKIYNPIAFDKNEKEVIPSENNYYLYLGRVSKEKGVELFCKAVTELKLSGIVVGDGSEKERLQKQYPNIEFTGWKNNDEVKKYIKGAKMVIFPSLWYEGAPLIPLEAMSLGIPCLVSNCCAAREYVDKKYLFDDYESLKKKMIDDNIDKPSTVILENFCEERYYQNVLKYFDNIIVKKEKK